MNRGSALLEVLAIGFVAAVLILQTLVTVTRLQTSGESVSEAAQAAALHGARYDDAAGARALIARLAPERSADEVRVDRHHAYAEVEMHVPLAGPPGAEVGRTVRGEATVRVSPYRSIARD